MSKLEKLPYVFHQITPQTTIVDIIEEDGFSLINMFQMKNQFVFTDSFNGTTNDTGFWAMKMHDGRVELINTKYVVSVEDEYKKVYVLEKSNNRNFAKYYVFVYFVRKSDVFNGIKDGHNDKLEKVVTEYERYYFHTEEEVLSIFPQFKEKIFANM